MNVNSCHAYMQSMIHQGNIIKAWIVISVIQFLKLVIWVWWISLLCMLYSEHLPFFCKDGVPSHISKCKHCPHQVYHVSTFSNCTTHHRLHLINMDTIIHNNLRINTWRNLYITCPLNNRCCLRAQKGISKSHRIP